MAGRDIKFIKLLRCIATIMVLWWHLGVMFWYSNQSLSQIFRVEFCGNIDSLSGLYKKIIEGISACRFDFGMFGVAVFFLITGFLVAHTIGNKEQTIKSSFVFLIKRILRIWPVYVCAFSITFLCLQIYNGGFFYNIKDYLIQASLLRDWFWRVSIDGISWTLEAQLKFYLFCFGLLIINKWNSKYARGVAITGMVIFRLIFLAYEDDILAKSIWAYRIISVCAENVIYIIYMFFGVLLNDLYEKRSDKKSFLVQSEFIIGAFFVSVYNVSSMEMTYKYLINYGGGILLFLECYWLRDRINAGRFVNFIDEKSYAIFLLHGANGYIILSCLQYCNVNALASIGITVLIVIALSFVFNKFVENGIAKCNNAIISKINSLL